MCLCMLCVFYCVVLSGVCCVVLCLRVLFTVSACFVCEVLCDVVVCGGIKKIVCVCCV